MRKAVIEKKLDKALKLLVRSSVIVFVALILSKIFTYLYRIIIARYLGAEIYGLLTLAMMMLSWFAVFSSLGLNQGILRFISLYRGKKEEKKIKYIFNLSLIFLLVSSLISSVLLFSLSEFISLKIFHTQDLIIFLKIFSIGVPFFTLSKVLLSAIKAYEKIAWYSFIVNILENISKLGMLLFLIFLGFKTHAVVFSYVSGILIVFVVSYLVCKYKISGVFGKQNLNKDIKKKIAKDLFTYSWPLLFFLVINRIFYWIDFFILGYFKDAVQVGIYNVAVPIALLLRFAPDLFLQLFFPLTTKEYSRKNLNLVKEISKQLGKWIFILNIPVLFIMFLFPGAIIKLLFGSEYFAASTALRILSVGTFVAAIFKISDNLISMIGKSKLLLTNLIITIIFNIVLDIILIPKYGINGAAIATASSFILLSLMQLVEAQYLIKIIPIRRKMIKIFLVSIIPLAVLLITKRIVPINLFTLISQGVLFFLLYSLLILVTGCLDRNDLAILGAIRKKIGI